MSSPLYRTRRAFETSGIPVTLTVVIANVVLFLLAFLFRGVDWAHPFVLISAGSHIGPIEAFLLYVFGAGVGGAQAFISLVFACLWMFWMGGSLERSWGSGNFAIFFAAIALISALGLWLGTTLLQTFGILAGLWVPLAALTVAWATLNPEQTSLLYFVIPVKAKWLAAFMVGVVFFMTYGSSHPFLGAFPLLSSLAAWWYVRNGRSLVPTGSRRYQSSPRLKIIVGETRTRPAQHEAGASFLHNPQAWYLAWRQRKQLEQLFKNSGLSDKDNDRDRRP